VFDQVGGISVDERLIVYRILDANFDRAREGLRILEEWCRFGLNDGTLSGQFKHLRQRLGQLHRNDMRLARNTPDDPGTGLTHPQEALRETLQAVIQANFCRVQEALRVLEEYGKLDSSALAGECKQMRYQLYSLESQFLNLGYVQTGSLHQGKTSSFQISQPLSSAFSMNSGQQQQLSQAQTYLVTSPCENLLPIVEAALQGGIDIVQYRDKVSDDALRLPRAQALKALAHQYGALFFINDRVDLALAVDADGVHLGQQDLPIQVARDLLGPNRIIGRSTTNPEEMAKALAEGADYIGVGPVYATPTKPGKAAAGFAYVAYAAEHANVPWFAIGGIDLENVQSVLNAGASRVAIVRAIMDAPNPTVVAQAFKSMLKARFSTPDFLP
jgi:thiamine-phosphate pyrophosphorylase